jgi:hypothetical protein
MHCVSVYIGPARMCCSLPEGLLTCSVPHPWKVTALYKYIRMQILDANERSVYKQIFVNCRRVSMKLNIHSCLPFLLLVAARHRLAFSEIHHHVQ